MTLDDLLDMWDADANVDSNHLDKESLNTPKLHSKYVRLLMQHKMKVAALQAEYNNLKQKKFRYYRGELSREELKEFGWDQWQGVKPLKNELEQFLQGDADLIKITLKIDYINVLIEALESILTQIKGRDWSIKNAITWRQFISGG